MNNLLKNIKLGLKIIRSIFIFSFDEIRRGTFLKNIRHLPKFYFPEDMSWAELLEEKAALYKNKKFLTFEDQIYSFNEINQKANKIANFLKKKGGRPGKGCAIFMDNSPHFLNVFFGLQKLGMYSVPVNTSLKGERMLYILNHCDAEILIIDAFHFEKLTKIKDKLEKINTIIVNTEFQDLSEEVQKEYQEFPNLKEAEIEKNQNINIPYNKNDICLINYTSGTTGLPKGVVYRYQKTSVKALSLAANLIFEVNDILYTCTNLFSGNALFIITSALHIGAQVVLAKKFSASKFWDEMRKYQVTTFNTIGAMIPILMKQPEKSNDNENKVRMIVSAACPADLWEKFEKRYGLKIYETYGAVDGGGKTILNLGNGPIGSIGRPPLKLKYRLVDPEMNDVPDGQPGELIFASSKKKGGGFEYYKNTEASEKKEKSGWIYTGDLMRKDQKGYLYFVGRNTESMRIKGENLSSFEVE